MVSTLFQHGMIRSLESENTVYEAMLVTDGRIVALGTEAELRQLAPADTEIVALDGGVVLPGFHDAHFHIGNLARELEAPDLRGAASLDETLTRLRNWADTHPGEGWVLGGRWDRNLWPAGQMPTRQALDTLFGERPVSLPSVDGHAVWANTAGLRAAGIDAATPDPVGGRIEREADSNEPSGLLLEATGDHIRDCSEAALVAELHELLERAQQTLLACGITQITNFEGEDVRAGLERLRSDGRLAIRVHIGVAMSDLDLAITEGRRTGRGDDWLTDGPVKLFSDGALGSHTAHLHDDFTGEPGNHGIEVIPFDELCELVERAVSNGIAVATHAIGDRANTLVLDAYERHRDLTAAAGLTNRIEHAQHLRWDDVPRFAALGVVASQQPIHCTSDFPLSIELLGDRDIAHYPWRSLLDSGALVAFGSDAPVEPANPLYGVHAAVTRETREGQPPGGREPEQRLTLLEALRAFTEGGARAAGLAHNVGRLAPGFLADFIVLDRDIFTVEPHEIPAITVRTTVVGGRIVHCAA